MQKKPFYKHFLKFLDESLEESIAIVIFVLIAVFMGLQVCARYIFNSSLSWPEEICVYLLMWVGMISLSYCIRKKASIKVEMVIMLFPEKVQTFFHILEDVISIVFYGYLCIPAWTFLQGVIKSGQVSPALHLPLYLIQAAPFIAFILAVIRSGQSIWLTLHGSARTEQET